MPRHRTVEGADFENIRTACATVGRHAEDFKLTGADVSAVPLMFPDASGALF